MSFLIPVTAMSVCSWVSCANLMDPLPMGCMNTLNTSTYEGPTTWMKNASQSDCEIICSTDWGWLRCGLSMTFARSRIQALCPFSYVSWTQLEAEDDKRRYTSATIVAVDVILLDSHSDTTYGSVPVRAPSRVPSSDPQKHSNSAGKG